MVLTVVILYGLMEHLYRCEPFSQATVGRVQRGLGIASMVLFCICLQKHFAK